MGVFWTMPWHVAENRSFDYSTDNQIAELCPDDPLSALFQSSFEDFFVRRSPQISIFQLIIRRLFKSIS